MTIRLRTLAYAVLALLLSGAAVYWSGIIPVSASSGHWGITNLVLHTYFKRAVLFHSRGIAVPPDLVTEARIRRAAGHYETGCAPCHGSPARPQGAVPPEMTPHPPELEPQIAEWDAEHLFWIIKHGVKFSGMPAWPTLERDDEAWAMAAFLLAYPDLTAEEYLDLAYGDANPASSAPGALSLVARPPRADCVRCHGEEGLGHPSGAFPRLDIQTEEYLYASLVAYHLGRRHSGIMQSAAAPLTLPELAALAEHYAEGGPVAPESVPAEAVPPDVLARGAAIARHGIPEEGVAACLGCHNEAGETWRPEFPRLDGQYSGYLELQLALFAVDARRGGAEFVNLMSTATHTIDSDDIVAVSAWFASRDPRGEGSERARATPPRGR